MRFRALTISILLIIGAPTYAQDTVDSASAPASEGGDVATSPWDREEVRADLYVPRATTGSADPEMLKSLKELRDFDGSPAQSKSDSLRIKAVREQARTSGVQAGLYHRIVELRARFDNIGDELDGIYPFERLMIRRPHYVIVPPVITDTDGGMRINDQGNILRIASKTYRIIKDPRFATAAPNWRQYLFVTVPEPESIHKALRPRNEEEYSIWVDGVEEGWRLGQRQAERIMQVQVATLTRDFTGMVRYHLLREHNMITEPLVKERYLPVVGGGRKLSIEDSVIRIDVNPELNADANTWVAIPRLPSVRHLLPEDLRSQAHDLY